MTFRVAITAGEPAGIGPDLVIHLAQSAWPAELVVIADADLLTARAAQLDLPLQIYPYQAEQAPQQRPPGSISVLDVALAAPAQAGVLNTANAAYVLATLTRASTGCLNGEFAAMMTAPVHKGVINDAGINFSGHTEFLRDHSHSPQVVMMLASAQLRVALATTHIPLREVADQITPALLTEVIEILANDLRTKFNVSSPRILVCGLNPHAGEQGHLGKEEIDTIIPVIETLNGQGFNLVGPLPADTLFQPQYLKGADAVLAMYHDQGLPVLKYQGFGNAMNITLGLPYIRTSVDHGTALDLAGTHKVSTGSAKFALTQAIELAQQAVTSPRR